MMRKDGDNKVIMINKHIGKKCLCRYYDCVLKHFRSHTSSPASTAACMCKHSIGYLTN